MKADQFKNKLNAFSAALVSELPVVEEKVCMNSFALIKDRIINEGTKASGASLGSYSENELPLFFYSGKSLNSGGEKALAKAKKEQKGLSYKDFREANNRPTDHKTFSFSGQMWADIGVVKQIQDGVRITTIVGARNTKTRTSGSRSITTDDIMSGLADTHGDFLTLSAAEEKRTEATYDAELQKLIDKYF
ncbi:MAG: hypothetical protein M3R27_14910 [Bacteroidota bacterium]|nr:hypothetical protein [Bacteroidota bacterium]